MNRRDFIKSLAAAAGSVAFADSALAAVDQSTDLSNVVSFGYEEAGNGWYRIWKTVRGDMSKGFSLHFGEQGLKLDEYNFAQMSQTGKDVMTFSCYVKGQDVKPTLAKVEMWAEDKGDDWLKEASVQLSHESVGRAPTSLIPTYKRSAAQVTVPAKNLLPGVVYV